MAEVKARTVMPIMAEHDTVVIVMESTTFTTEHERKVMRVIA